MPDSDRENLEKTERQLQKINDLLRSGLKSCNVNEFRNISFVNLQDSLDATYSMYVHFNITDKMTKIVSIELSFWLLPYRAYNNAGIYEEDNSPTVGFQISKDNGKTYGAILGKHTTDVENLEIKDYITSSGSYIIKFTSSARARLNVQATVKLDVSAR